MDKITDTFKFGNSIITQKMYYMRSRCLLDLYAKFLITFNMLRTLKDMNTQSIIAYILYYYMYCSNILQWFVLYELQIKSLVSSRLYNQHKCATGGIAQW